MSESAPTPQDYSTRLRNLTEKREELITRHARLVAVKEQAEKQVVQLKEEMTALNTSPEKLDDDVAQAETNLAASIVHAEKSMSDVDQQLTIAG